MYVNIASSLTVKLSEVDEGLIVLSSRLVIIKSILKMSKTFLSFSHVNFSIV